MPISKLPIKIGKQNPSMSQSTSNNGEQDYLSFLLNLQDNLKLFLSILIIVNFLIIFSVKFLASVNRKIQIFLQNENKIYNNHIENSNAQNSLDDNKTEKTVHKANDKYDILLIIAHPDDEVVFFSPTLKLLSSKMAKETEKFNVRLLCLSNGNYDKIGKIREDEFAKVMKALKIKDFELINDERIQDDFHKFWDKDLVCEKIKEYFEKDGNKAYDSITHVITFDENGVTKHPNHISCYYGLE